MWVLIAVASLLVLIGLIDLVQRKHTIRRNFPIVGRLRYVLEAIGPEIRQYLVSSNDEELPFNRDQRRWVYASSKKENNAFGFGTDNDLESSPNHIIVKNHPFPLSGNGLGADFGVPCAKIVGGPRKRKKAFRPQSIINISAMSFGALSARAVEAINRGCALAGCLHNTGEGGISPYHKNGGELIWQLGTAYFGARDRNGMFSRTQFLQAVAENPVRAIEIKLSQGAKPGLGGLLPGAKVTAEIAGIRGIPIGENCYSPSRHTEFGDVDELLDFVEGLASDTGLPIGIKSAIGQMEFWHELAQEMSKGQRGVDYIAVDGGEGGTGAAPLVFSDHVAMPFKLGMSRVYRVFVEHGVAENVVFVGAGKLGFPAESLLGFALGCDLIHVAREAMLAIGCIQAQRCHTGHCPAGVATQSKWLMRGLDPTLKAARLANYVVTLRKEILQLCHAAGVAHPSLISTENLEILDDQFGSRSVGETFGYKKGWGLPAVADRTAIVEIMTGAAVANPSQTQKLAKLHSL